MFAHPPHVASCLVSNNNISFSDFLHNVIFFLDVSVVVAVLSLDSPRDTTIEPSGAQLEAGQELTCTTRSNPDALYEWFQHDTVSVGVDQTFFVRGDWVGEQVTLVCQATNAVGSERKSISFSVVRKYCFVSPARSVQSLVACRTAYIHSTNVCRILAEISSSS